MNPEFWKLVQTALGTQTRVVLVTNARGVGQEGDDTNAEPIPPPGAEVIFPLGFASRPIPTATTQMLVLRDGDEAIVLAIIDKGAALFTTAPELAPGESRVFSPAHPERMVRCTSAGVLELRGSAYAGQRVARVGDHAGNHTHGAGTMTAGPWPVVGITSATNPTIEEGAADVLA